MHTFDLLLILGKQFVDFIELNDSLNSFVTTFFFKEINFIPKHFETFFFNH